MMVQGQALDHPSGRRGHGFFPGQPAFNGFRGMPNRFVEVGLKPGGEATMPIEPAVNPPTAVPAPTARLLAWLQDGGWRPLALGAFGALSGGSYAHFSGCRTGSCVLLSSVRSASVAGALIGLVIGWPSPSKRP